MGLLDDILAADDNDEPVPCPRCGIPSDHMVALTDGTRMCCPCWNTEVALRQEARKAELAARPKCESCNKTAGTWIVGHDRVLLCGRCKKRAQANNRVPFFAGPVIWDRAAVLELAKP